MKKVFFTDMDNTIISNEIPQRYGICVATKHNKNSSYMTNEAYENYIKITNKIPIIPVTTRCERSYNNIYLKKYSKYALVDNGAVLVCKDKKKKQKWLIESRKIIENDKKDFETLRKILEDLGYEEKWGSEFVLDYVHPNITDEIKRKAKQNTKEFKNKILINFGDSSVTCTYKKLSKGRNIKRFAKKYKYKIYITAGDNKEDISMYKHSKYSFGNGSKHPIIAHSKLNYCEQVIENVLKIVKN